MNILEVGLLLDDRKTANGTIPTSPTTLSFSMEHTTSSWKLSPICMSYTTKVVV